MVEHDVIYEEIASQQRKHQQEQGSIHERSRSLPITYGRTETAPSSVYIDGGSSDYVKMNSVINVLNSHDTAMMPHHGSACSSSSSSFECYQPMTTRSAEEIGHPRRVNCDEDDEEESVYAEIVTSNINVEITTARITRESNNPILRQELSSTKTNVKRACSLNNLNEHLRSGNCMYGVIDHRPHRKCHRQSSERKKRPQSMYMTRKHNQRAASPLFTSQNSILELYENAVSRSLPENESVQEWEMNETNDVMNENNQRRNSTVVYENIDGTTEKYYENVSDTESDIMRERRHSRPIDIIQSVSPNRSHDEVLYSDIDFSRKSNPPFSYSSSSVTSSPRGSVCSSMSSEHSIFASNSTSPPPLPNMRKRMERYASWGNVNAFTGLHYYPAHYLGKHLSTKVTSDSIEQAVCHVAQNTNVLEMKPVLAEISHEYVRFGSNSSPWELLVSFQIEEVIGFEVVLKNAYFLGIIAGKPGEDAFCYVLQSDKSTEIGDAISSIFQTTNKIPRSQSSYEWQPTIEPEFLRFHLLVEVGCIKVKKSYHNVNDYIKLILEKVNPRDFRSVSLELLGQNIIVSETTTEEEKSHSTPSILTLGVYQRDKRYFGYIISEMSASSKTKVQCYVYRAARNETAAKIIEAINHSCQNSYAPRMASNNDINPIYSTYKVNSPRVSTSSSSSIVTTPRASSPTSLNSSPSSVIKRQSSENEETLNIHGSTETLLTITPSPSCDKLPRSSAVRSEVRRVSYEMERCASIEENPIYEKNTTLHGHTDVATKNHVRGHTDIATEEHKLTKHTDVPKKQKHRRILGKLRHTIKHKTSHDAHPTTPVPNINELQPEEFHFKVSYVCSTMVNPPLKQKHVKECYKQYCKEMNRVGKLNGNNTKVNGNLVNLQIVTDFGVSMLDPHQPDVVVRHFPIQDFGFYQQHSEDISCFAFSTSLLGNSKHRCHLFCATKEVLADINVAFEKLSSIKKAMELL